MKNKILFQSLDEALTQAVTFCREMDLLYK